MQHFLLTRFNLKTSVHNTNIGISNLWLNDRFKLFEDYCLPSVLNQTNKNFTWIFFFDKDTPQEFKDKALKLSSENSFIKILFIDGFKELNESCNHLIKQFISEQFIITTRLDNDDILHKDFIKTIQNLYRPNHNLVIDLRKGYQIIKKFDNYDFKLLENKFNPFVSVVENSDMQKTVLSRVHIDWKAEKNVIIHDKKCLWIELVHGKNITNTSKKYVPEVRYINFSDFSLPQLSSNKGRFYITIINLIKAPLFLAFTVYKKVQFKLLR